MHDDEGDEAKRTAATAAPPIAEIARGNIALRFLLARFRQCRPLSHARSAVQPPYAAPPTRSPPPHPRARAGYYGTTHQHGYRDDGCPRHHRPQHGTENCRPLVFLGVILGLLALAV